MFWLGPGIGLALPVEGRVTFDAQGTMNRLLLATVAFALAACDSNPSKLYGAWERDAEATLKDISEGQQLEPSQEQFLEAWFGCDMVITYRLDGTGTIAMGRYEIPGPDGSEVTVDAAEVEFSFEILGEAESQVVIKVAVEEASVDERPFSLLQFPNRDGYCVTLDQGPFDLKGKEFFRRVEPNKGEQAAAADSRPAARGSRDRE